MLDLRYDQILRFKLLTSIGWNLEPIFIKVIKCRHNFVEIFYNIISSPDKVGNYLLKGISDHFDISDKLAELLTIHKQKQNFIINIHITNELLKLCLKT